jgi:hypothetical protein
VRDYVHAQFPPRCHIRQTLVALGILIGQSQTGKPAAPQSYPVWWSPELKLKSLADIPVRMRQAFSKEEMDELREEIANTPTPHNCEELLQTTDAELDQFSGYRMDEWGTLGVQCAALRALKTAVPAKRSFVHDLQWTVRLFSLLPVASAWAGDPSDEGLLAGQEKGLSIREFWPKAKYTANRFGHLLQEENADDERNVACWAAYVKYASGDFNGDGLEDIVMWTTGGSGDDPAARLDYVYLLTRTSPGPNTKLTLLQRLY